MKPLPLHSLPSARMASLTNGRRLQILEARQARRTLPGWTDDDRPAARDHADNTDGCGGMAVVGVVLIGIIASIIISLW